jgi:hypothetical protein
MLYSKNWTAENRCLRRLIAAALAFLLCPWTGTRGTIVFHQVPRNIVEARLNKYAGNNQQREATHKQLFADAGCDAQHVSEQSVKKSRLPNVVCVFPGSSDKIIIVGAHFDHVSEGTAC